MGRILFTASVIARCYSRSFVSPQSRVGSHGIGRLTISDQVLWLSICPIARVDGKWVTGRCPATTAPKVPRELVLLPPRRITLFSGDAPQNAPNKNQLATARLLDTVPLTALPLCPRGNSPE